MSYADETLDDIEMTPPVEVSGGVHNTKIKSILVNNVQLYMFLKSKFFAHTMGSYYGNVYKH